MPLDIAAGILLSLLVANLFHAYASAGFILLGIAFALFPDIDGLLSFAPGVTDHRSLPHYPLVETILAIAVTLIWGNQIGLLFVLCVFFHLLHDTFFFGWGVRWLWPLSNTAISIFHDKDGKITRDILYLTDENKTSIRAAYKTDDWFKRLYLRPSYLSLIEYPAFLISLVILVAHFLR